MQYKLHHGGHSESRWILATKKEIEGDVPGLVKRGDGNFYRLVVSHYNAGDIVESDRDLPSLFNARGGPLGPKFSAVTDSPAPFSHWDDLESKTEDQLRALAILEEIDVAEAKTKEDLLKLLQSYAKA